MSLVTNVMVSIGILEQDDADACAQLVTPGEYASGDQTLRLISDGDAADYWGGGKFPECTIYAAAFNYLDWDEFVQHIESCGWAYPDEVQVFVMGQEEDRWSVWQLDGLRLQCVMGVAAESLPPQSRS